MSEDSEEAPLSKSYPEMLGIINQQMTSMRIDIRELRKDIASAKTPDMHLLIAFAGIVVLVTSGLYGLAISPIKDEVKLLGNLSANKEITEEKFVEASKERLVLMEKFKDYATKDDLNRLIIDVDRRLPKAR